MRPALGRALNDRFHETNQIESIDFNYGPHPEEHREAMRLEGWKRGTISPVAVLRDARCAGSSGRGRYDSNLGNDRLVHRVGADECNAEHVGRARRAERDAGDDDDAAARLGEAILEGEAAGA